MATHARGSVSQWDKDRLAVVTIVLTLFISLNMSCAVVLADDIYSIARGGRLFDNWILENKDRPPTENHPQYQIDRPSMHSNESSWRCVSCHGWKHEGRIEQGTGVLKKAKGSDPGMLASILRDGNHQYGLMLSENDFSDLAAYIQADIIPSIDPGAGIIVGDPEQEVKLYATICANCHGDNGLKLNNMLPLGTFARRHPEETMHKIFNGHPGERMPPFRFLEASRLADLFAYIQTLPDKNLLASIARGGRLYDHWQKETGAQPPTSRHPAYPRQAPGATKPLTNWRCKECHGWDYKGLDGAYGRGSHRTDIKGIRALAGSEPQEVMALLMDRNHRYHGSRWFQAPLDLQDLIDLANFVSYGQIDMDEYIVPISGIAKGNPEQGKDDFNALCATCHGKNGKDLATGRDIGDVARKNPWEALHKIRNGHPDEAMPALHALDMTFLVDILAHAQTLP
ncbi:MAG: c-type cytochrome [Gammaproteobacteria bacterium]|nr:c-type cytochrome [Gammaproteobacteria bacterium]